MRSEIAQEHGRVIPGKSDCYVLGHVLGSGSFGTVFHATSGGKSFAIKTLKKASPSEICSFRNEVCGFVRSDAVLL